MKLSRTHLRPSRRTVRRLAVAGFVVAIATANVGPVSATIGDIAHQRLINSAEYKAQYGYWSVHQMPEQYRINAIHAALLHTGKVLIVAGSGNDEQNFEAGSFKTIVWDPATDRYKDVPTPKDFFCSGHAFLPDGRLVIAGGTQRYEILQGTVTKAAGAITVKNEDPDAKVQTFKKGTKFTGPNGKTYLATNDFTLPPATKMMMGGQAVVHASSVVVWAEAVAEGKDSVITKSGQYKLQGLKGDQTHNVYGLAEKMTLEKQDFQGTQESYVFDPVAEKYDRIDDMTYKRWYPTLVGLENGDLLASSGLDGTGQVLTGQTEILNHETLQWDERTDLNRYFPTYPALFLTAEGKLFYSGSNAGYGPADKGREPGLWDLLDNSFTPVKGLRDADQLETSGSVLLPPAQSQKVMVIGGGGVGESPKSTARTDIADLKAANPAFTAGPDLAEGTRYPNVVVLPDDTVLVTGGSRDYRGKGASDNLISKIYHPSTNSFTDAAAQSIGRDYHSEGILLPDGRVVVMGSNPLFSDKDDTKPAKFEQRLEIYSPPYLFAGDRPSITGGPQDVARGTTATFITPDEDRIKTAKLVRPSAATHATDVEQRSVDLAITRRNGAIDVAVPEGSGLTPAGWYMMFVTDERGVPSVARWVHVP